VEATDCGKFGTDLDEGEANNLHELFSARSSVKHAATEALFPPQAPAYDTNLV